MKREKAKRIAKRITALAAAVAMAATFTFPAEIGDGFFDGFGNAIVASAAATQLTVANGDINITLPGDYEITGTSGNAKITVDCTGTVNIKLNNLNLQTASYQGTRFEINNGTVNLELDGDNLIQAHQDGAVYPSVKMSDNAELHIYDNDDNGSIKIHGSSNYYGGGDAVSGGSLYIHSGSVLLVGGSKVDGSYGSSFNGKTLDIEGGSLSFSSGDINNTQNGNITVSDSFRVGSGVSLTVPTNGTIEIGTGASAIVDGTIINKGTITNNGTLTNNGSIINFGSGSVTGTVSGNQPDTKGTAFTITGSGLVYGTDYTYPASTGVLTIKSDKAITIANANPTATTDRIEVEQNKDANITLAGVNIDLSGTGDLFNSGIPAFKIADNSTGNVTLTLADGTVNSLKSGFRCAGLQKNGVYISANQGKLIINGAGSLEAIGGYSASGIGGVYGSNITINGGIISATGGDNAAGIGSDCQGGYSSHITINGGIITANGGNTGAGIGGGSAAYASDITINGGTVIAKGKETAAGIGSGAWAQDTSSNITISGGTVSAIGGEFGAGIGGNNGCECGNVIITGGSVNVVAGSSYAYKIGGSNGAVIPTNGTNDVYLLTIENPNSEAVTIDGSNYTPFNHKAIDSNDGNLYVYLTGTDHTVKVGSTSNNYEFNSSTNTFSIRQGTAFNVTPTNGGTLVYGSDYNYPADTGVLTIKSATPITIANASTGSTTDRIEVADGISANITLAGVNISTTGAAFKIANNSTGNVTITLADDSVNTLTSGMQCAGLQKNGNIISPNEGKLTIQGETRGTGKLTANGGDYGAGIGGNNFGSASNITISGGTVTATGGSLSAGIGGGYSGSGSYITISGGIVTATGTNGGADIGGGASGSGSSITITGDSVKAVSISGTPTDGNGNNVYLREIANDSGSAITINGKNYPTNHNGEAKIYAYLPAKSLSTPNEVTVGNTTTYCYYDTINSKWINVIDDVTISIDNPTAGDALATSAAVISPSTGVEAITSSDIVWKDASNNVVSGTAGYNKEYTVYVTLKASSGYAFKTDVGATVSTNGTATVSNYTADEITVEYTFTTAKAKLISITNPTAITGVANGTAKTADALGLPSTVAIVTEDTSVTSANVSWDVSSASYDPSVLTVQTFTVNGTVTLPTDIVNTDNVSLNVTISVTVSAADTTAAPTASPNGGTYTENQSVVLSCTTSGAAIYYTTDGTAPTASSTRYTSPISVTGTAGQSVTTTIKAIAVKDGMQNSSVATFTYIIEIPVSKYLVTVNNGTLVSGPSDSKYAQGDTVTITANTPEAGKQFKEWTVISGNITLADPTNSTTTFEMPANAVEVTAAYENIPAVTHTITATAGAGGSISPSGSVTVAANDSQTFTITPDSGYEIDTLTVDNVVVTATTSYTFTNVTANHTISVTFKQSHTHSYGTEWKNDSTSHWHECSCGDKTNVELHTEDSGTVTTEPTETTEGVKTFKCVKCEYVMRTETIPPITPEHTHEYSTEWKSDSTSHWHECTCGEKADIAAHISDNGVVTLQPTETSEGIMTYSCSICDYILRTESIPAIVPDHTHEYGTEWKSDSSTHWHECPCGDKADIGQHIPNGGIVTVQPTATSTGLRVYSCSICGYVLRRETIPVTGYNDYPSYPSYPTYPFDSSIFNVVTFTDKVNVTAETEGNTVTIKWDKVEKADKYYVYQYKNGKYVTVKTTSDTSATFKKLKNGETYKFLIRYTKSGRLSPTKYSGTISVKVYYKPIPKATATKNSVKLTWDAVPEAEKYAIYKYVDGKAVKLAEIKGTSVKISKLSPDTEYKYIVRAYVDGKWTTMLKSDIVTVKTKAE